MSEKLSERILRRLSTWKKTGTGHQNEEVGYFLPLGREGDKELVSDAQKLEEKAVPNIQEKINETWGKHNEFRENGWRYVSYAIQRNVDELAEKGFSEENCVREFSDILLIIFRQFHEQQVDLTASMLSRLDNRMKGKTDEILAKYLRGYKDYRFPIEAQRRLEAVLKIINSKCPCSGRDEIACKGCVYHYLKEVTEGRAEA